MLTALFASSTQTVAAAGAEPNPLMMIVPFALIFGIFYFLVIRPQNRKLKAQQQEQATMIASLKKGDRIITVGGVFATVHKLVNDEQLEIEIAQGVYVTMLKAMISKSLSKASESAAVSVDSGDVKAIVKPVAKAKTARVVAKKDKGE